MCWCYGRACRQAAAGSSAGSCRQLQAADKRRGCGTRADGGVAFDRHALPNMGTRGGPRDPSAPASTMKPCAFMAGDQEVRSLQQCRIYVRNLCREWLSDLYRPQSFSLGSISSKSISPQLHTSTPLCLPPADPVASLPSGHNSVSYRANSRPLLSPSTTCLAPPRRSSSSCDRRGEEHGGRMCGAGPTRLDAALGSSREAYIWQRRRAHT